MKSAEFMCFLRFQGRHHYYHVGLTLSNILVKFSCLYRTAQENTDYGLFELPLLLCIQKDRGRGSQEPGQRTLITNPSGPSGSMAVLRAEGGAEQKQHCTFGRL